MLALVVIRLAVGLLLVCRAAATIVVGAKCADGVVIGTDSRVASSGGRVVSNRAANKLHRISDHVMLCYVDGKGSEFNGLCRDLEALVLSQQYPSQSVQQQQQQPPFSEGGTGPGGWEFSAAGTPVQVSTLGIAAFARRLINAKYRSVHVLVASGGSVCGGSGGSVSRLRQQRQQRHAPALVEILPNGFSIEHPHFVACGPASSTVQGMLERDLERDCHVEGEEKEEAKEEAKEEEGKMHGTQLGHLTRAVQRAVETAVDLDSRCGGPVQLHTLHCLSL